MKTQFFYSDEAPCQMRYEYINGRLDTLASAQITGFWRPAFVYYN